MDLVSVKFEHVFHGKSR